MNGRVRIKNLPNYPLAGYIVARLVSGELWYYGCYETEERAKKVVEELGNGLIVEVSDEYGRL